MKPFVGLSVMIAVSACSPVVHPNRVHNIAPSLLQTSQLLGAGGEVRGKLLISQIVADTRLVVEVSGMAPGSYALHLHAIGKCEGPDFKSAGPHFNPTAHSHGKLSPTGPHLGDLPNVTVAGDGKGHVDTIVPGLQLVGGAAPLLDTDGAALVLHAGPDDYLTDPSGNSGARIACAVLNLKP